jgi:hypothetical protein
MTNSRVGQDSNWDGELTRYKCLNCLPSENAPFATGRSRYELLLIGTKKNHPFQRTCQPLNITATTLILNWTTNLHNHYHDKQLVFSPPLIDTCLWSLELKTSAFCSAVAITASATTATVQCCAARRACRRAIVIIPSFLLAPTIWRWSNFFHFLSSSSSSSSLSSPRCLAVYHPRRICSPSFNCIFIQLGIRCNCILRSPTARVVIAVAGPASEPVMHV